MRVPRHGDRARVAAVVVAGGTGTRFGTDLPKQYLTLKNRTVLGHTLDRMTAHPAIDEVVVVLSADHTDLFDRLVRPHCDAAVRTTPGGNSRTASVHQGLRALQAHPPDHVLVHDAVRMLVGDAVINAVIGALADHDGAGPTRAPVDAHWEVADESLQRPVDKTRLFHAQTPQGFAYPALLAAFESCADPAYDCAATAVAAGMDVVAVPGAATNLKITTAGDLDMVKHLATNAPDLRSGQGVDIHAFAPGDGITLFGVLIEADCSLRGHSDADAGLHAITDALYGALAQGDIGVWFPPSDPQWKNADSAVFLAHARDLCRTKGYAILSIDSTVIAEKPKISRHCSAMRERVATLLEVAMDRISIKGTTAERLGFIGEEKGLMVQTTVLLGRP